MRAEMTFRQAYYVACSMLAWILLANMWLRDGGGEIARYFYAMGLVAFGPTVVSIRWMWDLDSANKERQQQ